MTRGSDVPRATAMAELPTGTVTFLFTDVEHGGAASWPRSQVPTQWLMRQRARQAGERRGPGTRLWELHPVAARSPSRPPQRMARKRLSRQRMVPMRGQEDRTKQQARR